MDKHEHNELDNFVKKMVKEAGLEAPSEHFTEQLLHKIQQLGKQGAVTAYQPLISRTTWLLLGIGFIGLFVYFLFAGSDTGMTWLSDLSFDFPEKYNILDKISKINISKTISYSVIGISLFVYIQIFLLKRYMDGRITLAH